MNRYSITADGERFLFAKALPLGQADQKVVLVRNWIREFSRAR